MVGFVEKVSVSASQDSQGYAVNMKFTVVIKIHTHVKRMKCAMR
jgi:hypothetical protein